ncbi:hypothetical protein ACFLXB_01195 [Chloroflexota bacterium]
MRKKMKFGKRVGVLLILLSVFLFLWLLWPYSQKTQEISFQPGELIISEINYSDSYPYQATEAYAIPYGTQIILSWMPVIRKGGVDAILLQVIQDERYMDGSGTVISDSVLTEVKMRNIFEDYSVMAKSRLDMRNAIVDPPGESGVALLEDGKVTFSWKISPQESGLLAGTVWFFLVAFADDGNEVINKAVSAQHLDINVISLLGINVGYLWTAAILATILGTLLCLDISNLYKRRFPTKKFKKNK